MADTNISVDKDQFCCSVCLEVLWEPVTIPCGHSYCMECIKGYWRKCELKEEYSCPQCRRTFSPRPALSRNTMLADIVEKLRRTGVQDVLQSHIKDVDCDVCTGRKHRAVKFCVKCQTLYCEIHLKPHNERNRGRMHQLIEVTKQSQKRICSRHNKLRGVYCRTDQQCICSSCLKDGHKGHSVVSIMEERTDKQKHLEEVWRKSKQRCKEREKELRDIVKYIKRSAQVVEDDSEKIFTRLLRSIERKHTEVKELIRGEERTALGQTEKLLEQLNQQITEHKRGEAELEMLSNTEDHINFLQNYKNLCAPPEVGGQPSIDVHPYFSLLILRKALTELKERVTDICDRESARISEMVDEEHNQSSENISSLPVNSETARGISPQTEPMTRGDFLQYCRDLTLDPNTANSFIRLSGDHREVTTELEPQSYSDHPERFSSWAQVLCTEGLSGRCYWEVEWGGSGGVSIGVSYKGIPRTGGNTDRKLGCNSKSWSLDFSDSLCLFRHDKSRIEIHTPMPNRIGVYLDHRAGTLAFYSVSLADDSMTLLHQEQTTFAQPLYPGFWVGLGSTLKLCQTFSFSA
ncbi:tripartite motif-containing protein 16 isoform X1 [Myxocyprinus asiaticus]|uniref:tripartite motif-containing protein 16 isoform X1 n=1 Tax=Myxocyprinus asiaticus TaxID=70543 RepID=UPI0022225C98|nr:tripartite motif-containing protein 16 isoform X1 [Myxocyprinus asiaticus]